MQITDLLDLYYPPSFPEPFDRICFSILISFHSSSLLMWIHSVLSSYEVKIRKNNKGGTILSIFLLAFSEK